MSPSNNFYTSSPTVVLPPTGPGPCLATPAHYADEPMIMNAFPNANTFVPASGCLAGRKRSRGDVHDPDEDEDGRFADGSVRTPPEDEDMMPVDQLNAVNGSFSNSWAQEHPLHESMASSHNKRPSMTSRKSQRMHSTADEGDELAQLVLPPQMRDVTTEPLIDEATRSLGISWTRMDSSEALRINQAAYAKWIQNHYPRLNDVSVWFENSAIPGYLVTALNSYSGQREYYIFSNDLTEARLITNEPNSLVPRLQMLPALHLAAPGGCIHAETNPIAAVLTHDNQAQAEMAVDDKIDHAIDSRDDSVEPMEPLVMCAAHSMAMD